MRPDAVRDHGLDELGVGGRLRAMSYDRYGRHLPFAERKQLLDEYKRELKKLRNETALACHPDRTADLPEAERKDKSDRMIRINRAVDYVMKLEPRPDAPQLQPMRVFVIRHNEPFASTSTGASWGSSTVSTGTFYGGRIVFTGV